MKETKKTIREQDLRRQKNTINAAFKFLKTIKAEKWKKVPHERRVRELLPQNLQLQLAISTGKL